MEIISFESFALFILIVALVLGMVWRNMRWAAKPVEDSRDQREEDDKTAKEFREALAQYNDTEHGQPCADMEPFAGAGDAHAITMEQERRAQAERDRQERSRKAVRLAQIAVWDSVKGKPFLLTPQQEQEARARLAEKNWRDRQRRRNIEQHNSSFRATGMTPLPLYSSVDYFQIADTSLENGKMLTPEPATWDDV